MKIYTKAGDEGETSLFSGKKIPKHSLFTHTYGTVDELNSFLGLCIQTLPSKDPSFKEDVQLIQHILFSLGSDLATPLTISKSVDRISHQQILDLEKKIDAMEAQLTPIKNFILPGGSLCSVYFHVCRSVCRRAERYCSELKSHESINNFALIYLNRLSDYLFVCSRYVNYLEGIQDFHWDKSVIKS